MMINYTHSAQGVQKGLIIVDKYFCHILLEGRYKKLLLLLINNYAAARLKGGAKSFNYC